jgi:C1A family cysteine protease
MTRKYPIVKDKHDPRDLPFSTISKAVVLPASVDLRAAMPPVYDQGQLGSCTGNAIAAAYEFDQMKEKIGVFQPSRLFIYYNERLMEGTVSEDSGAEIRDGIKVINKYGICSETSWPYNIESFTVKPPVAAYSEAAQHVAMAYYRVPVTLNDMKTALASGFPIVGGITLYESFESDSVAKTGKVAMPKKNEKVLGGHAILFVGYDDKSKRLLVRNSWGSSWGQGGYFTLPYAYITDTLVSDLWVVTSVK